MDASFPFTSSSNHLIIQNDAFPLYLKYCGFLVKKYLYWLFKFLSTFISLYQKTEFGI